MTPPDDFSLPTRRQALRAARTLGCEGAHQHDDGSWMPCASHTEMVSLLKASGNMKGQRVRQRRGYGAPPPRKYQQLIERGIRGIESLPGGGLVSSSRGIFVEKGIRGWFRGGNSNGRGRRFLRAIRFNPNARDADGDGTLQEHTPHERPATPDAPASPKPPVAAALPKGGARVVKVRRRKRRVPEFPDWNKTVKILNEKDGGFTLQLSGQNHMKSGWAIARNGKGIVIPRSTMFDKKGEPTEEGLMLLEAFIDDHADVLLGKEDTESRTVALGTWHNPDTGMLHIDVTDVFSKKSMTKEQAVEMGSERDQIAIADLDLVAVGNWKKGFPDTGGTGGGVIDADSYNGYIADMREAGDTRPLRPSLETRTEEGPENVEMVLTAPIKDLAAKHDPTKDWHDIVSPDAAKRRSIADYYDEAPDLTAEQISDDVRKAYEALTLEVEQQFEMLTKELGVDIEFVDYDPYENFLEMREDFIKNRRMKIMRTAVTGSHPFMTDEQNDKFRAVHDAFGHLATGRGFDRHGEEAAYQAHRTMFSKDAVPALATETRGQNMFLIDRGTFGPQKLVLLPDGMMKSLRAWLITLTKSARRGHVKARIDSDADNAYTSTRSHHVSGGRVLPKK